MWSPNFAKVDVKQYWYGYMDVDKRWGYVTRSVFWWEEVLKLGQIVIISFKFSVSLHTLALSIPVASNKHTTTPYPPAT